MRQIGRVIGVGLVGPSGDSASRGGGILLRHRREENLQIVIAALAAALQVKRDHQPGRVADLEILLCGHGRDPRHVIVGGVAVSRHKQGVLAVVHPLRPIVGADPPVHQPTVSGPKVGHVWQGMGGQQGGEIRHRTMAGVVGT